MFLPISNKEISKIFELISKLLELIGENEFKIKSYSIAAFKINKHPMQLSQLSPSELESLDILNKSIKPKVIEILTTGTLTYLDELAAQIPAGLLDLLQIKGLGAKKIKLLYEELGIQSIGELLYACQENRISMLKGFGIKTQNQIIQNIQFIQSNSNKYLYAEVDDFCQNLSTTFKDIYPDGQYYWAGDYTRQNPVVEALHAFTDITFDSFIQLIQNYTQGLEIDIDSENNCLKVQHLPLIIHHTLNAQSGVDMLQLNSSPEYWQQIESQLSDTDAFNDIEILEKNQLPLHHPAQREAYNKTYLTTLEDFPIKGLIHCHSDWSDGTHSIEEMAFAAQKKGMEYMLITDHSVSAFYANGLTKERIDQQHQLIDSLNQKLYPFKIFKGIEADILYNGQLDYDEETWKKFDLIIGSVHAQLNMTQEKATERILTALDNPYLRILGHPTGRLLLSRKGYELDYKAIFEKCQQKKIVIELNAHPRRLDLDCSLINQALDYGLILSINSDAHSIEGMEVLKYGIKAAQKTQLTARHNLSSWSLSEFENFIVSNSSIN